jgi:hypothetical protein
MTSKDAAIDAAINAAVRAIQDALGVTDGGFASIWFNGERETDLATILGAYYDAEIDIGGASDPDAI